MVLHFPPNNVLQILQTILQPCPMDNYMVLAPFCHPMSDNLNTLTKVSGA